MNMDSLLAIGLGVGLRAVIDSVTQDLYKASALIGLWEGVVLNHFLLKHRRSYDPYIALGFRLFVDFMFTESFLRMAVTVLWAGLGLVFTDLGRDLTNDRRFRRLWRRIRRLVLRPASSLTRVRFLQGPRGSTSSVVSRSTVRSPTSVSSISVPLRPSTRPVPGAFDQWSEITTDAGRDAPSQASDRSSELGSTSDIGRNPLLHPPQPPITLYPQHEPSFPPSASGPHHDVYPSPNRSASELSYAESYDLGLPVIPDQPSPVELEHDEEVQMRSGLTTPTNDPMIHDVDPDDRPYIHSGLTTPNNHNVSLTSEGLPPVRIIPDTHEGTPTRSVLDLPPIPIRPPPQESIHDDDDDDEHIAFPEPQIPPPLPTPGFIPPVWQIPNIPTVEDPQEDAGGEDNDNKRDTLVDPPPRYESVADLNVPDHVSLVDTESDSVVTEASKGIAIKRAESLRREAWAKEKERDMLRQDMKEAQKHGLYIEALRLELEAEEAHTSAQKKHAQARRRLLHAHNERVGPQEIDVHGLVVQEARAAVKAAIRDAYKTGAPSLRIIVGRGKHSKNNIPVLKPDIIRELQKYKLEATPQETNPGVLVVTLPSRPDPDPDVAGPSGSAT